MDELVAAMGDAPCCRLLSGVTVVSVRFLPGDTEAQTEMRAQALPWVQSPGQMAGADPYVCWRTPQERLCVGLQGAPLRKLLQGMKPGRQRLSLALDLSEACAVFEMHSAHLEGWLHRLVDAAGVPMAAGRVSACSLAHLPVLLLRLARDRLWLLVDRPLVPYVSEWLSYSHAGARVAHAASVHAACFQSDTERLDAGAKR